MTPNNDFLDNLANDRYQKLIQEVYNDDMLKKTTKNKNNNELIERVDEEDSSEGKQINPDFCLNIKRLDHNCISGICFKNIQGHQSVI